MNGLDWFILTGDLCGVLASVWKIADHSRRRP